MRNVEIRREILHEYYASTKIQGSKWSPFLERKREILFKLGRTTLLRKVVIYTS